MNLRKTLLASTLVLAGLEAKQLPQTGRDLERHEHRVVAVGLHPADL